MRDGVVMWLTMVVISAVVGVGRAVEAVTYQDRTGPLGHLVVLLLVAIVVAGAVETVRGFFIVYLSMIGAYKAAKVMTEAGLFIFR